jgi:hypothetical protein
MLGWLKHIEELKLWRGWYELVGSLVGGKGERGAAASQMSQTQDAGQSSYLCYTLLGKPRRRDTLQ